MKIRAFFDEITFGKDDKCFTDGEIERFYSPYLIVRILACYQDLIPICDMVNCMDLSKKDHFLFLLHTVPKKKRRMVYSRKSIDDRVNIIGEFYGISTAKAYEYSKILTNDQIAIIQERLNNGGREKN